MQSLLVLWVPVQSLVNRIHLHCTWQKKPIDISRMTVIHIRRMRERGIARVGLGDGAKDDEEDSRGQEARGSVRSWRRMTQRNRAST